MACRVLPNILEMEEKQFCSKFPFIFHGDNVIISKIVPASGMFGVIKQFYSADVCKIIP